jgi:hypothetical protein
LKACGIDPQVSAIENAIKLLAEGVSKCSRLRARLQDKNNIPLTRENYLNLAYLGNPPEELCAEEESMLPEMFQRHAGEQLERSTVVGTSSKMADRSSDDEFRG